MIAARARLGELRREVRRLEAELTPIRHGQTAVLRALETQNVKATLSPGLIKSLVPPAGRADSFVWDTELRGWGIRLLASGTASWVTQCRVRGQPTGRRRSYARCDRLPFTLARERAREILALADLGKCWHAEQAARAAPVVLVDNTVGTKIDAYLDDSETKQLRTYASAVRYLRVVWAPLHGEDAETVTSKAITEHLERIALDRGVVAANRARSRLSRAFGWLLETHRLQRDGNPCARARRWQEARRRRRAPTLAELGAVWKACGECWPQTFGSIVRLLVLTAARKSEIALLAKSEVDLVVGEITLPPARTKTAEWHVIPLSKAAVRILRDLPERRSARIFPVISWDRCKRTLDEASGVEGWTLHDLRRSFSSLARDELHADGEVVELCLGHLPGGVRGRYDFSERKAQRKDLLERWSRLVTAAAGEPVDRATLRVVR